MRWDEIKSPLNRINFSKDKKYVIWKSHKLVGVYLSTSLTPKRIRVKDSYTINFHIKDFDTILKIRILFHYFKAIPIYVAFCIYLQSAPYHRILNSGRAPIPRRRRRPLAPLIASPPPSLLVLVCLPFYISPFLVFLVTHELEAGDIRVRPKALRYR
jgi:hypothetical protein